MKDKILEAKKTLYRLLLDKDKESDDLTDGEVDVLFALSKDEQIQELLTSKIKK
ncbi:MAG TPA: hypothetical protein VN026_17260 [Bacteroidia bacterium]|jgi:hypothetical protein|nr:hypothetical protein [Bacteroidia bacterium]